MHGFYTNFQDAVLRFGQIVFDLDFKGLPILFSWPSRGEPHAYLYDRDSATGAQPQFMEVLQKIANQRNVRRIHILAHSMGNYLLLQGLATTHLNKLKRIRLGELVMAAPDVDKGLYKQWVDKIRQSTSIGMTLYASSKDRALALSKKAHGGIQRAGDIFDGQPILVTGVDSIDVTQIGEELFGHGTYAETTNVINDMKNILKGVRPPHTRLTEIKAIPDRRNPQFWKFVK